MTTKKLVMKAPQKETKKISLSNQIVAKKIGANFIATIDKKNYSRKVVAAEADTLKEKILLYNKRPSEKGKQEIIKLLTPVTIKAKGEKDRLEMEKKGYEKLAKREEKRPVKEIAKTKNKIKQKITKSESKNKDLIKFNKKGIAMKDFTQITMPPLLVDKLGEFLDKDMDMTPLLNFWSQCLLNPNEIARTKLFDYLSEHKFMVTPSGYFVTYRMVIATGTDGIFTDARTRSMKIKIGEVVSIPRSECDEDGGKDCSKGLHVGSPSFIGIEKGEGYNSDIDSGRGIGTGYSGYQAHTQFGNQPIIAFVNPRHVVSVPNSETRKLRCCEYYPFKLTTPQEVIDMEHSNYMVFEEDYRKIELKELMDSIDKGGLKEYMLDSTTIKRVKELEEKIKNTDLKIGKDIINNSLTLSQIKEIIGNRVKILENKIPSLIQL